MATWPGYAEIDGIEIWIKKIEIPIFVSTEVLWVSLNFLSTFFSIFGIRKILNTLQELKKNNPRIKTNKFILILHCVVLVLNLAAVISESLPAKLFTTYQFYLIDIILIATDTITQLCICYICWSMGSSINLRKFDLTILVSKNGIFIVKLTPRESEILIEEHDQSVYSSVATENSELVQLTTHSTTSYN
jgi:hypothetical protein